MFHRAWIKVKWPIVPWWSLGSMNLDLIAFLWLHLALSTNTLSNNCGCVSQWMMTIYCEILQLFLPHVYSITSIKEQCQATLVSLLPSIHISVGNSSTYEAVRITPSRWVFMGNHHFLYDIMSSSNLSKLLLRPLPIKVRKQNIVGWN